MKVVYLLRDIYATLAVFTLGYFFTFLCSSLIIISSFFNMRAAARFFLAVWANMMFFMILRRVHISGKENIEEGKKYLIIANHASFFDIPALMVLKPGVAWVGREKLMKIPLFRRMLLMTGYVPIKQENFRKAREALTSAVDRIKSDYSVAIFPEGTRTVNGALSRFRRGFIYIFRNSNLDILPVTINGTYALKPKNRFLVSPSKKIELTVHEPIPRSDLINKTDNEILQLTGDIIKKGYLVDEK